MDDKLFELQKILSKVSGTHILKKGDKVLTRFGNELVFSRYNGYDIESPFGGSSSGVTRIVKSENQDVVSSTTLVNCSDMFIEVEANKSYYVEMMVLYVGHASGDIKIAFSYPTDCKLVWYVDYRSNILTLDEEDEISEPAHGVDYVRCTFLTMVINNESNAGSVQLQFAQNSSYSVATTILKNSFVKYEEL